MDGGAGVCVNRSEYSKPNGAILFIVLCERLTNLPPVGINAVLVIMKCACVFGDRRVTLHFWDLFGIFPQTL